MCVVSYFFRDKVNVNFFGFAWRCVAINGFAHHSETATNLFYFWAWMRLRLYVQVCPPEDILKPQKKPLSFDINSKVDLFLMCRRENETSQILNLYPRSFWQQSDVWTSIIHQQRPYRNQWQAEFCSKGHIIKQFLSHDKDKYIQRIFLYNYVIRQALIKQEFHVLTYHITGHTSQLYTHCK